MDKYCENTDIENYLLTDVVDSFEPQVSIWIESVSRFMDNLANRKLVAPVIGSGEDFEVKYYDGTGRGNLRIDDCQEITKITVGDFYGDNPVELDLDDVAVTPKIAPHRILISKGGYFPVGTQNISVEGRFGFFNEVPADLRLACTILVAGIINNQNKGNQAKKSESIGNYSVTYIDDKGIADYNNALAIIKGYKKYDL